MILKGKRVVQEPSLQVNLHKVLNLSTGSSIATLERRNLETSTCTSRNFRKRKNKGPEADIFVWFIFGVFHTLRKMKI
jgi:hypothetical protein